MFTAHSVMLTDSFFDLKYVLLNVEMNIKQILLHTKEVCY